jgi:hypothetical protein
MQEPKNQHIEQANRDYAVLLRFLAELIERRGNHQLPKSQHYKNDAAVLAVKFFEHMYSVAKLGEGGNFAFTNGHSFSFVDHSSMQMLVRAAIETYLQFHYIYGDSEEELNRFRHACWVCGGLSDRQNYSQNSEASKEVVAAEVMELESVQKLIREHSEFLKYTAKEQKQLLEGNWKVRKDETSWKACAISAGFDGKYFDDIYSYLSGTAHSSYATAMQVKTAINSVDDQMHLGGTAMRMAMVALVMMADDFKEYIPIANDVEPSTEIIDAKRRWYLFNQYLIDRWGKTPAATHPDSDSNTATGFPPARE